MADQVIPLNTATALRTNAFSRSGYDFYGWSMEPDSYINYHDRDTYTATTGGGITLYARWNRQGATATTYFSYIIDENEVIIAKGNDFPGNIIVPDFIGDYPVTELATHAYYDDYQGPYHLLSIILPEGLRKIGGAVFLRCWDLAEIEIPRSTSSIEMDSLSAGLNTITVDPENEHFSATNGVLFDKDVTRLISYPREKAGASYTIPGTVSVIGTDAFYNCMLETLYIPASVSEIRAMAFFNCDDLVLHISAAVPPTLGVDPADPFEYADNFFVYVPSASVSTYKAAPVWSYHQDRIFAEP